MLLEGRRATLRFDSLKSLSTQQQKDLDKALAKACEALLEPRNLDTSYHALQLVQVVLQASSAPDGRAVFVLGQPICSPVCLLLHCQRITVVAAHTLNCCSQ